MAIALNYGVLVGIILHSWSNGQDMLFFIVPLPIWEYDLFWQIAETKQQNAGGGRDNPISMMGQHLIQGE